MLPFISTHASPTWQFIINGGYGFSPNQELLGVGYSKPAHVDTTQFVRFKEKWGTLGNGVKLEAAVCKYYNANVGFQISGGTSFLGITDIENVNGEIQYSDQYKSSYVYAVIGPRIRAQISRISVYSFCGVGFFQPYSVSYIYRYLYSDQYMNPHDSKIYSQSYALNYLYGPGAVASFGMEYKIKQKMAISFETNVHLFVSKERAHLMVWAGYPDLGSSAWGKSPSPSWPNSFNNISARIGLSYFK
jgi:hypothetical protein